MEIQHQRLSNSSLNMRTNQWQSIPNAAYNLGIAQSPHYSMVHKIITKSYNEV